MPSKNILLKVVTPDAVKAELDIEMVIMRAMSGDMGILAGHEDCSIVLDCGILRVLDQGTERVMFIEAGISQVRKDVVTILTNNALWPEDIDRAKVEAELAEAERHLLEDTDDVDIQRAQVMLRRSQVQIEVSSYPIISGSDSHKHK